MAQQPAGGNEARNLSIAEARMAGERWADIAKRFGISSARAVQIAFRLAERRIVPVEALNLSPALVENLRRRHAQSDREANG